MPLFSHSLPAKWFPAALLAGALFTLAGVARAGRPTLGLRYSVAEGAGACPSEAEFRERVLEEVGYDPFVPGAPARTLSIEISRTANVSTARIADRWVTGEEAMRSMSSTVSCDDVVQSVVLSVAVALDPDVQPAPLIPQPQPEEVDRAVATPTLVPVFMPVYPDDSPRLLPAPRTRDPVEGVAVAGFQAGGGFLEGPSVGPSVAVGLRQQRWEVSLEAAGDFPTADSEPVLGAAMGSLVPCYTPSFASWVRALMCGDVSVGAVFMPEDNDLSTARVQLAVFTGPRGGAIFNVAPHFDLRLTADFGVLLHPMVSPSHQELPGVTPAGRALTAASVTFR